MNQVFTRQQQEEPRVARRPTVIDKVTITATSAGTAQTIFTVPEKRTFELKKLMVSNISGADVTFSVYAVPPSGTAADANVEIKAAIIKANSSDDLARFLSCYYRTGYMLKAFCSAASAVVFAGWGEEVT